MQCSNNVISSVMFIPYNYYMLTKAVKSVSLPSLSNGLNRGVTALGSLIHDTGKSALAIKRWMYKDTKPVTALSIISTTVARSLMTCHESSHHRYRGAGLAAHSALRAFPVRKQCRPGRVFGAVVRGAKL
ncbi:hypothetical protein CEXT_409151 [Caerostris extrusa]|uniref:Uncharacterized protein n=1 Tax=Caerostris extrusa TaxID=172846 RepID=A0AAV4UVZ1_CAEEX|nr:hypothetical protein CEXT_409151 [Caerostris extrusa]